MELSIDTSTRFASICISKEGNAITELTWRSEQNHSVELAPAIRELMGRASVEMAQLEALFVARGPGGFSALRVGISTAKTMAVSLGIPLVSVPTLDIEAQPYLGLGVPVCSLIEAGRDRVYLGRYEGSGGSNEPVYEAVDHEALISTVDANSLFCGEGAGAVVAMLREQLGDALRLADAPPPTRRAGILALLGFRRWQSGETDDPGTLQPLYLRSAQVGTARRKWGKA